VLTFRSCGEQAHLVWQGHACRTSFVFFAAPLPVTSRIGPSITYQSGPISAKLLSGGRARNGDPHGDNGSTVCSAGKIKRESTSKAMCSDRTGSIIYRIGKHRGVRRPSSSAFSSRLPPGRVALFVAVENGARPDGKFQPPMTTVVTQRCFFAVIAIAKNALPRPASIRKLD